MFGRALIRAITLIGLTAGLALAQPVTTPDAHLKRKLGTDFTLAALLPQNRGGSEAAFQLLFRAILLGGIEWPACS